MATRNLARSELSKVAAKVGDSAWLGRYLDAAALLFRECGLSSDDPRLAISFRSDRIFPVSINRRYALMGRNRNGHLWVAAIVGNQDIGHSDLRKYEYERFEPHVGESASDCPYLVYLDDPELLLRQSWLQAAWFRAAKVERDRGRSSPYRKSHSDQSYRLAEDRHYRDKILPAPKWPVTWTVKCRSVLRDRSDGWHWNAYFSGEDDDEERGFHFGGANWIRSAWSKKHIAGMRCGNVVLCYQTEERAIHGLTRLVTDGLEETKGSGSYDLFFLEGHEKAFKFVPPVGIDELRDHGWHPACFMHGTQGTVFPVSSSEVDGLLKAVAQLRGKPLSARLGDWLREPYCSTERKSTVDAVHRGAGYGEAEQNRLVEQAAIDLATQRLVQDGWDVKSVERDRVGFDLECTRGRQTLHVEVKGVSGMVEAFFLTSGELAVAQNDPLFRLFIVCNSLGQPTYRLLSGKQFQEEFKVNATQYRATRRG